MRIFFGQVGDSGVHDISYHFYRRDWLDVAHRIAAADIEQARTQAGLAHVGENFLRPFDAHSPVLRIAALRTYMESYPGEVSLESLPPH